MNDLSISLPELSQLLEQRMALVRSLAESLESTTPALVRNDAQAIARGAAHQAELCRQWSELEAKLRREAALKAAKSLAGSGNSFGANGAAHLQTEWDALGARIRYVTRVHWSLLRHLERSLAVLQRLVDSCAATYIPPLNLLKPEIRIGAGK
ncbi:MAG: flagellar export chaperone FlgN [Terriglobales bacterium]